MPKERNEKKPLGYIYTTVPAWVLDHPDYSLTIKGFLSVLTLNARPFNGKTFIWPGIKAMSKACGISESAVSKNLAKCTAEHLITRKPHPDPTKSTFITELNFLQSKEKFEIFQKEKMKAAGLPKRVDDPLSKSADKEDVVEEYKEQQSLSRETPREETPPPSKAPLNTGTKSYAQAKELIGRWSELQREIPNLVDAPDLTSKTVRTISSAIYLAGSLKNKPLDQENWEELSDALRSEASWRSSIDFSEITRQGGQNAEKIILRYQAKQRKGSEVSGIDAKLYR